MSELGQTHHPPEVSAEGLAIQLFHSAVAEVPAYRRLISEYGILPESVRSIDDFRRLPITTKQNYHRPNPLPDLCRSGALRGCDMLAVSSGSTGEPAVWPRSMADEFPSLECFEKVLKDAFQAKEMRTLALVCFALGTWVGGMYTASCLRRLGAGGYPITVATPGNQMPEIFRVVRALSPEFDQLVLCGYPPFLKDLIDAGMANGVDFRKLRVRLILAGEVFSEEWRTLMCDRIGADDPALSTASLYGTADAGVLASETALSIAIRRFLAQEPAVARELFGATRLPTLCQYDPRRRFFETDGEELLFSADGRVPLLRYKILDRGGIMASSEMLERLRAHGFDLERALPDRQARALPELPFVWVFGRAHFAVSFYGANVYPESVMIGLEQPELVELVTGKFVMQVCEDGQLDSLLEIAVELARGVESSAHLAARVAQSIRLHLERLNSEFLNYVPSERRTPRIKLLQHGDPQYFPLGVKHRYTRA